jgi:hypothetical protein
MEILLQALKECIAFIWYMSASIANVFFPLADSLPDKNKKIIIFVHGVGGQPLVYFFLKKYLEKRGFSIYFLRVNLFRSLGIGLKDIEDIAKELREFISDKKFTDVVLIGCSVGAVPSLLFLEKYKGWDKVKKFIALSPAFNGGWLSYLFFFLSSSRQLRPSREVVIHLSEIQLSHPQKMVSIVGKWDEFVSPESGNLKGIHIIQTKDAGHAYLQTFSKEVQKIITEIAGNGS